MERHDRSCEGLRKPSDKVGRVLRRVHALLRAVGDVAASLFRERAVPLGCEYVRSLGQSLEHASILQRGEANGEGKRCPEPIVGAGAAFTREKVSEPIVNAGAAFTRTNRFMKPNFPGHLERVGSNEGNCACMLVSRIFGRRFTPAARSSLQWLLRATPFVPALNPRKGTIARG